MSQNGAGSVGTNLSVHPIYVEKSVIFMWVVLALHELKNSLFSLKKYM